MVVSIRKVQLNCEKAATLHEQAVTVQQNLSSSAETDKGISEYSDVLMVIAFVVYYPNSQYTTKTKLQQ